MEKIMQIKSDEINQGNYELNVVKILYGEKIANYIKNFYANPENRDVKLRLISKESKLEKEAKQQNG